MTGLSKSAIDTALTDPQHLKRWLEATGRLYLVFPAMELVDALPFPEGVEILTQVIAAWRDHRRTRKSARVEVQVDPVTGDRVTVEVMQDENLEIEELDRAIRYLIGQASNLDPTWSLDNPAM